MSESTPKNINAILRSFTVEEIAVIKEELFLLCQTIEEFPKKFDLATERRIKAFAQRDDELSEFFDSLKRWKDKAHAENSNFQTQLLDSYKAEVGKFKPAYWPFIITGLLSSLLTAMIIISVLYLL
ncbi:hypothetical protein [Thaumasiovibrio subtropicus]|uniref:hypothetical protein n=1 Tax=Thaumasiovibrio subtropicus TaxID=1891207 RepID=UPI000B35BB7D|nr:hypothetical protein [Thaumasiovibrio subtropicus]